MATTTDSPLNFLACNAVPMWLLHVGALRGYFTVTVTGATVHAVAHCRVPSKVLLLAVATVVLCYIAGQ